MSQAEVLQAPYLKYYSEDEINKMCLRFAELLSTGHDDEAHELSKEIPLLPKSANMMKRLAGIDSLIGSGVNLYEAVQEYGKEWLER